MAHHTQTHRVYIGIGSNLGDRVGHVQQATTMLTANEAITLVECSSLYETEPVGFKEQDWFINAVAAIETTLSADQLLAVCQSIEQRLKRKRDPNNRQGPRTIDLDILFYDDAMISTDDLIVPHPRFHERSYAVVPMLEIAADWIHPVLNETIERIHQNLDAPEEVFLYGTRR